MALQGIGARLCVKTVPLSLTLLVRMEILRVRFVPPRRGAWERPRNRCGGVRAAFIGSLVLGMGKVEKVVVLGVLFSVVVMLAVSLYSGSDEEVQAKGDPAARRREQHLATRLDPPARLVDPALTAAPSAQPASSALSPEAVPSSTNRDSSSRRWTERRPVPGDGTGADGGAAAGQSGESVPALAVAERPRRAASQDAAVSGGLLSSNVRRPATQVERDQAAAPAGTQRLDPAWDLITVEGLTPTFDPRFQVYTCGAGETFSSVARKLYGSEKKSTLLRRDNESLAELRAGQELLVAVVDDRPGGGDRYQVHEGESLWRIAKKVYGAGSRWKEIYEANRDTLASPDPLPLGVVLRIP